MESIKKFFTKIKEWYKKTFKPKTARAATIWLCIALAGIILFSCLASLCQTNGWKTEVTNIYANINGVNDNISMTLYKPKKADGEHQVPFVVATHGYLNNKEMVDMSYVELSRRGYAVVAVDASVMNDYHGESGALGKSATTGAGLVEVIDYFTQKLSDGSQMFPWLDFKNIGVIGHSMGGATVNGVLSIFAGRETTAFRELRTKYMAAPYNLTFPGSVGATASSGQIFNHLRTLAATAGNNLKAEINADIEAAKARNKVRAGLAMAPQNGQTPTAGLETVYASLIGGRDEMFLTTAGASSVINSINAEKKALDERNTKAWFQSKREYANQYEFAPVNNYASDTVAAMVGAINPDYRLPTQTTIFGEAGTGKEVFTRRTMPRDLQAFKADKIDDPLKFNVTALETLLTEAEKTALDAMTPENAAKEKAARVERVISEYKAYLSKQDYFDRIWKELRDWNSGTDKDGNPHVQVAAPTTDMTNPCLIPVDNGDGTYSEGRLVEGGIYTRDGYKSDITWKTGFPDAVDPATGLRPVFRTFYISAAEIHPWNHFSTTSAGNVSTFFMTAFGKSSVGTLYAPGNQAWWAKEMFNFFAMICFLLIIIPICQLLAKVPFFAKTVQPVGAPKFRLKKWYEWLMFLVPAGLLAFFAGWSILEFTAGVGYGVFSSFFSGSLFPNQTTTNYIATWAAVNGIVGLAVFMLIYFIWNRPRGARFGDIGLKTKPGGVFRSLLMAIIAVTCAFLTLGVVDFFFNTDFRLWVFAAKWFHSFKLGTAIMYMFIFIVYYFMLALTMANNRWKNIPEWLSTLMCALINVVGVIAIIALTYGSDIIAGGGWTGTGSAGSLQIIGVFPIIPVVFFASILSRKLYKVTGSIWLPAFATTMLFVTMSVTGTIIAGDWFRLFGL